MVWNPENLQRYEDEMRERRIEQSRQQEVADYAEELALVREVPNVRLERIDALNNLADAAKRIETAARSYRQTHLLEELVSGIPNALIALALSNSKSHRLAMAAIVWLHRAKPEDLTTKTAWSLDGIEGLMQKMQRQKQDK